MRILKVLSALLTYPDEAMLAAMADIDAAIVAEPRLKAEVKKGLRRLVAELSESDPLDAQERYLLLFDRTRSLSLHLFEHVHGESRDRGQAMVDLVTLYGEAGFEPATTELPDYLPMFLEFASTRSPAEAQEFLKQPAHVLAALRERLAKRNAPYVAVFDALLALAQAKPDASILARLIAEPDPEPTDLAALDADWEEQEVLFGPGAALDNCQDNLGAKLRQSRRPAPGLEQARPRPQTTITTSRL